MAFVENKKAYFDYEFLEKFEAGLSLLGHEVKAVRKGNASISGSFVVAKTGRAELVGADIPPYQPNNTPSEYDSKRTRKLLLKKSEIQNLAGRIQEKGLTLLPLKVYSKNRRIKIEIGLGKSKKTKDKEEDKKSQDVDLEDLPF